MIKVYTGTQYIVRHLSGNGELCDRYETLEDAIKGRSEAQSREVEYRKEHNYESLIPTEYLIVKSTWTNIYEEDGDQHRFVSHTLNETVVPEV